ncbi:MAG: hypothetical protein PGN13_09640 [Patulibacter minatonensis]
MLEKLKSAVPMVIALVLIVVAGSGVVYVLLHIDEVPPAMGAAVIVGTAGLLGYRYQAKLAYDKFVNEQRRERIAPVYDKLIEVLYGAAEGNLAEGEFEQFFREFSRTLLLWAPSDVVALVVDWRESISEDDTPAVSLFRLESLIRIIRKDLGQDHSEADIPRGNLLRLFVNDLDEVE